jgi:hypothetical protein
VVLVAGVANRPEGDDGRRAHPSDDLGETVHLRAFVLGCACPVGQVEELVVPDAEDGQRRAQFVLSQRRQPCRRPRQGVWGAVFPTGGGDAGGAVASVSSPRHQAAGEVGLVVGVGPDPQHGAEIRSGRV